MAGEVFGGGGGGSGGGGGAISMLEIASTQGLLDHDTSKQFLSSGRLHLHL